MEVVPEIEPVSRFGGMFDNVKKLSAQAMEYLPNNWSVWLIALTCLIVLVAISRVITLQKSVTELQSRPIVDETTVRIAVRQHLEETARAMEQHNKAHAMARQAEQQAREEHMRQMIIKQAQEQAAAKAQEDAARAQEEKAKEDAKAQEQVHEEKVNEEVAEVKEVKVVQAEENLDEEEEERPPPPKAKKSKGSSSTSN